MKKIFTFLVATGTVIFASAQSKEKQSYDNRFDSRDVVIGHSNSNGYGNNTANYSSSFSSRERDVQIQKINHDFDQHIAAVKRDRHLRSYEKSRQIKMLEKQRDEQIKQVQMRFSNSKNRNWQDDHRDGKW